MKVLNWRMVMFEVGDKIVYPMHGAGVIEEIEEKEVLGEKQFYYIFHVVHKNMQVMIPRDKTSNLGIRDVVDASALDEALSVFKEGGPDLSINRHQRYNLNMKKMKSGDICENAQVIRDLMLLNRNKNIGTEDKAMLDNALQIFLSELTLVKGIEMTNAQEMLEEAVLFNKTF